MKLLASLDCDVLQTQSLLKSGIRLKPINFRCLIPSQFHLFTPTYVNLTVATKEREKNVMYQPFVRPAHDSQGYWSLDRHKQNNLNCLYSDS